MSRRLVCVLLTLFLFAGGCFETTPPVFMPEPPTAAPPAPDIPLEPASPAKPSPTPTAAPPTAAPTPPPVYTARIAFTGDLMVHEWQLESAYHRETDAYMFKSFDSILPYLNNADYTVGNLETTLAGRKAGYATYPLFNTPDAFAEAIQAAGFDFVSTANNHCYDKGEKGVLRTLQVLDGLGLSHTGTFASEAEAEQVSLVEINRIRFAFLSYTYGTNGIPVAAGKPYLVNRLEEEQIRRQIEQARQAGADVIIVLPHMGNEYEQKPTAALTALARNMCQWGADVVMASHPHVLQPTEVYEVENPDGTVRTCFIAYSMGNFISSQRTIPRDASAVFYLTFAKTGGQPDARLTGAAFAPTWVKFMDAQGRYDIRVLPVYDTLLAAGRGEDVDLQITDIDRLRAVHRETTRLLLGEEVPAADMRPRYVLYGTEESFAYGILALDRDTRRRRANRLSDQLARHPDVVSSPR